MNTADVAAKLETTPRTLRTFLRADSTYKNAGSGGRYDFQESDIPLLKKRFIDWRDRKNVVTTITPTGVVKKTRVKDRPGIHPKYLRSRDPLVQARIRKLAEERVDRLEASLKARGLHISQMSPERRAHRVEVAG